jgi:hypothetical protein
MDELKRQIDSLKREVEELKRYRFANLTTNDVEELKKAIFDRTVTTATGAVSRYYVFTLNGKRGAVPVYDTFTP